MSYHKTTIDRVEIEIGDNLFIRIDNVSFIPSKAGYISGRPEDCYEDEPAECSWRDEDCKLIIKKKTCITTHMEMLKGMKPQFKIMEFDYECDPALAAEYYDLIIEAIEQMGDDR